MEKANERLVRFFWPRIIPGYDFTDESRRTLADSEVIVAFTAACVGRAAVQKGTK